MLPKRCATSERYYRLRVRRLYCRKCGYDLTPHVWGEVVEATCPECGSLADKRRSRVRLTAWWRKPAIIAICIGTLPGVLGLAASGVLDGIRPNFRQSEFLPLTIPVGALVSSVAAFRLFPRDVPGRPDFGRLVPFLVGVFVASLVVNFLLVAVCSFVISILSVL